MDDGPVIAARVPVVLEDAQKAGHLGGHRISVTAELDSEMLATVKCQTDLQDTGAVIGFALAHVALDADFVAAARRRTWQAIDDDGISRRDRPRLRPPPEPATCRR